MHGKGGVAQKSYPLLTTDSSMMIIVKQSKFFLPTFCTMQFGKHIPDHITFSICVVLDLESKIWM